MGSPIARGDVVCLSSRILVGLRSPWMMGEVEGGREGGEEMSHIGSGRECFLIRGVTQILGEAGSIDVAHYDVGQSLLAFLSRTDMEAVHRHNVGMLQGSDELRLVDAW